MSKRYAIASKEILDSVFKTSDDFFSDEVAGIGLGVTGVLKLCPFNPRKRSYNHKCRW